MNSIVSATALSSAIANATPLGDPSNGGEEDAELIRLGALLDDVMQQTLAQQATDKAYPEKDSDDAWNAINGRLSEIVRPLMSRKAKTKVGLSIQAYAASIACQDLWECMDDEECPLDVERVFIEAVCRHVGIVPFPLRDKAIAAASNIS